MGSRLWLIPVWIFPDSARDMAGNAFGRKRCIIGGVMIFIQVALLVVNYYIPNHRSSGVISPSVYIGANTIIPGLL
ncbi:MAG: hypothetical protein HS132_02475 [Planctomycetia bacterium]|nr:hypothetical protein [Planctomycetia bacterium]